eukprot:gene5770-6009_t
MNTPQVDAAPLHLQQGAKVEVRCLHSCNKPEFYAPGTVYGSAEFGAAVRVLLDDQQRQAGQMWIGCGEDVRPAEPAREMLDAALLVPGQAVEICRDLQVWGLCWLPAIVLATTQSAVWYLDEGSMAPCQVDLQDLQVRDAAVWSVADGWQQKQHPDFVLTAVQSLLAHHSHKGGDGFKYPGVRPGGDKFAAILPSRVPCTILFAGQETATYGCQVANVTCLRTSVPVMAAIAHDCLQHSSKSAPRLFQGENTVRQVMEHLGVPTSEQDAFCRNLATADARISSKVQQKLSATATAAKVLSPSRAIEKPTLMRASGFLSPGQTKHHRTAASGRPRTAPSCAGNQSNLSRLGGLIFGLPSAAPGPHTPAPGGVQQ